ncbi:CueP family metal-binding protein [Ornithinimicrobium flavum]|uniref:CueP family metal-binding protein n=1 Tax=Ornithinimicrobium flavum TaxID=1288636 RepID=UPI0010700657|nr:CueP family metal-binding protein [Ornithinimicrobium flavum]
MKRTAAALSTLALIAGLSACSGESETAAPESPATSADGTASGEELPDEVASALSDLGVEGDDVRDVITSLDRLDQERPLPVQGSVRTDEVIFSTADTGEVAVPIPGDEVYISVAPYVDSTHDCFYHALGGCQGELVGEEVSVTITDDAGETLVQEDATTYTNGFVGFWLPKDVTGTVSITHDGMSGEVPFDTSDEGATCITTLQLS